MPIQKQLNLSKMDLKVKQIKNYKLLNRAMKEMGNETHGHKKNEIGWIIYRGKKKVGVVGLRHLGPNYAIIDAGPSAHPKLDPKNQKIILDKLMTLVKNYVREYAKVIYTHNVDQWAQTLIEKYRFKIERNGIPDKKYTHPCLECKYRDKDCFPVLLRKKLR